MRPGRILHPELAKALAEVGHGDTVLITDAGFPIPRDARRVDLGLVEGTVDALEILRVIRAEIFAEEIRFDPAIVSEYPSLYASVQQICTGWGADFVAAPHEELVDVWAPRAKVVIRSGSFTAWANFAITAATDPFAWFREDEDVTVLPRYLVRRQRITDGEVPRLPAATISTASTASTDN